MYKIPDSIGMSWEIKAFLEWPLTASSFVTINIMNGKINGAK